MNYTTQSKLPTSFCSTARSGKMTSSSLFGQDARRAREMNHLPIADGSLDFLRHSPARRKIYTHINNTNPILMPGSRERAQVERAGIEIACDGLEIAL